ncbi:hypothetical protein GCM10027195_16430 [Comamonas sediminis]
MADSDRGAPAARGTGVSAVKAPNRKRSEEAKREMMATLRAIRSGRVPAERITAVLGAVSTIVDSFVLDYLDATKNEHQQKHR